MGVFPSIAQAEENQRMLVTPTPAQVEILAENVPTSGSCGDNLTWSYDWDTQTLTISGTGDMWNFDPGNRSGWTEIGTNIDVVHVVSRNFE